MASKRKRDFDEEILSTPNAKIPKQEEVTRSGRVRKKPAKFADDVGDDLNLDASKSEQPAKTVHVVSPPKPKIVQLPAASTAPVTPVPPPPPPPVTKIVTIQEPTIKEEDMLGLEKKVYVEEDAQSSARKGRARKKSAKVLEMEEFEEAEKKQVNKKDASKKQKTPTSPIAGMKGLLKSPTSPIPTTVAKLLTSPTTNLKIKDIQPPMKMGSFSPTNIPSSPVKSHGSSPKSPGAAAVLTSPTGSKGSVIKLLLSSPAQSSNPLLSSSVSQTAAAVPEKSSKKKKAKEKSSPADDHLKLKQALEMPQHTGLSPVKQELCLDTSIVKTEVDEKLGIKIKMSQLQKDIGMIQTSAGATPKSSAKEPKPKKGKKANIKDESVFLPPPLPSPNVIHVGSSNLGIEIKTEPDTVPKKKSKAKAEIEKQKVKVKLEMEESMMDHEFGLDMGDMNLAEPGEDTFMDMEDEDSLIIPEEEIDVKPKSAKKKKVVKSKAANKMGQADFSDMPSDSDLVMDFSRMKSEDRKKKKAASKEVAEETDKNTSKKKRAPTAYMLWCNDTRPKVVMENPGIDFSAISKTLGEMWSGLPEKEKLIWKRKAKKAAGKGSTLITTGKAGSQKAAASQATAAAVAKQGTVITPKPSLTAAAAAAVLSAKQAKQTVDDISMPVKGFGIEPVDVAAHLKIVGESLSIIGMRLQEHRGLIAVQGSLSVLLDSMLCAVAPLMCLTAILPETNGLPHNTHMKNLDNIAYVMPGL